MCLGDPLDQSMSASSLCFVVSLTGDVVLICGFWDNSFKSFTTENGTYTKFLKMFIILHYFSYFKRKLFLQGSCYRVYLVTRALSHVSH